MYFWSDQLCSDFALNTPWSEQFLEQCCQLYTYWRCKWVKCTVICAYNTYWSVLTRLRLLLTVVFSTSQILLVVWIGIELWMQDLPWGYPYPSVTSSTFLPFTIPLPLPYTQTISHLTLPPNIHTYILVCVVLLPPIALQAYSVNMEVGFFLVGFFVFLHAL